MRKEVLNFRSVVALCHDVTVAALAWIVAYALRFNFTIPPEHVTTMMNFIWLVLPIQASFFVVFGLYRGTWRFASLLDLQRIVILVLGVGVLLAGLLFMLSSNRLVPRSVLILDPLLLILFMGGSRFIYRSMKEHQLYSLHASRGEPVVVFGAGATAMALVKDLAQSSQWRIVGLLDEELAMHGREVLGIKVLGGINKLGILQARFSIKHAIIAMPTAQHNQRRLILNQANQLGIQVLTVPAIDDLMSGRLSVSQIRRVDVEDLLGRDAVNLDCLGLQHLITGHVVMVSGAGGSIGSELCRQIAVFKPSLLICFDISEFALYQLEQSMHAAGLSISIAYVVGDVKNERRLTGLMQRYQPKVVFHAAAYKHVPMMEKENVTEALNNNVVGTYTLAKVSKALGVQKFVMVSTDKAVNPTNVMGASKRLAEMVCQSLQDRATGAKIDSTDSSEKTDTTFVIVRFGNVLGSSGSVIPKFREQIAKGGPVTVTHPEITRYFMSIPEAAQLVMQAGLMGKSSEIFVLDMGDAVKITDLARDMIKLSGLTEDDIKIEFTGLRPGEKLYEELLADDEHTLPTPHPKLRIAAAKSADEAWVGGLLAWIEASATMDEVDVKEALKTWVVEYVGDINATQ